VLWECGVAQGVWARNSIRLHKCTHGQAKIIQLFEDLLGRLTMDEFENVSSSSMAYLEPKEYRNTWGETQGTMLVE